MMSWQVLRSLLLLSSILLREPEQPTTGWQGSCHKIISSLMYTIRNLADHLAKINQKRAASGTHVIKGNKWADHIPGTRQVWFSLCLPKARTGAIDGMADKDKVLELLAAVNSILKSNNLQTIPISEIVELVASGK